ncbi:hypothetical protein MTsPCn9_27250 [Croceitalea sp. MTPC9]|nr:hypothetical protein MTsPCn6_22930 [Croceitalea sp. MTPC6]GMN17787.1 hypothetical protein MTsPCn9_27250 [Croceitalea sp. MTPC9]
MPDKVITPKYAFKGCMVTGCAILVFLLGCVCYLIYIFYFDDSLDFE